MKSFSLLLAVVAMTTASCSTAKKESAGAAPANAAPAGLRDILTVAEPVPASTIASLKAIADDPAYMLPAEESADEGENTESAAVELTEIESPATDAVFDVRKEWKRPGINPDEVNPGDVFFENAGPVLHKTLSLADELKPDERKALLDHYTVATTARVPVTITKSDLAGLKEEMPADFSLPTRSVALDYRSEKRTLKGEPYLELLEDLEKGESGGAVESAAQRARLKDRIAAMKKQMKAGERLFVVTGVVETDKLRATYPGAPLGSRDAELVRNAIAGLYPHLISLEAVKNDDAIELIAPPRILWEFDTREIKLEGDKLVIDFESVVQL
jgi:hypothetical protein